MKLSRRDLSLLLPALAVAQTSQRSEISPSQTFLHEDLAPHQTGPLTSRQMLKGNTHTGYPLDVHESELPAGEAPHAPHHHVHEELLLIREGLLEVTIGNMTTRLGAGSSAYLASNQEHGWRNAGTATARYFVVALGSD